MLHQNGFSNVLRAITIKSYNVSYEPRAITRGSDDNFHKPRVITIKAITFLQIVEALSQKCNLGLSPKC
jgi:hypothetical protein